MTVIPLHPRAALRASFDAEDAALVSTEIPRESSEALLRLLAGQAKVGDELPPLSDLVTALLAMAEGTRRKALLPLAGAPSEVALLRRGGSVLVSWYHTDAAPDVVVLDRRVPLRALLDTAASALEEQACRLSDPWSREVAARLVRRAAATEIAAELDSGLSATRRTGGALEDPGERQPLAFGFEAAIFPSAEPPQGAVSHADVHAMLFGGSLWAWVRGRRIPLSRGPIMLAISRMVASVRALVEAWEEDRAVHVRLRSGSFVVGVRRDARGEVALTLGGEDEGTVTVPALDVPGAVLPILRVASDLVRALVSVDRSQARNLRVSALRDEVRRLRRVVRDRVRVASFVNEDPDRLRASAASAPRESAPPTPTASAHALRFVPRWTAALDGLDASTTFLCGDRLLFATARRVVAIDRDSGLLLWQKETPGACSFLAGTALVRLAADGLLELRDARTGDAVLRAKLAPRLGGPPVGLFAGGGDVPPTAIVSEGADRLVAIDVRTGEPRWRFSARGAGAFKLRRAGRLLLVVGGDASIHAIEIASGAIAWRHTADARFCLTPAVCGDVVLAALGEPGRGEGDLVALDLFEGRVRFRRALGGPLVAAPMAAGDRAVIAVGGRKGTLAAFEPEGGELCWMAPDPGLGVGGSMLAIDQTLVINAPMGRVTALALDSGEPRWSRSLAHPVSDDVPRRLAPVLRGGALFVPSATVHVLRPSDGASVGGPLPCDLVPDALLVDERGWTFVAEESGHVQALAPAAHLTLLR